MPTVWFMPRGTEYHCYYTCLEKYFIGHRIKTLSLAVLAQCLVLIRNKSCPRSVRERKLLCIIWSALCIKVLHFEFTKKHVGTFYPTQGMQCLSYSRYAIDSMQKKGCRSQEQGSTFSSRFVSWLYSQNGFSLQICWFGERLWTSYKQKMLYLSFHCGFSLLQICKKAQSFRNMEGSPSSVCSSFPRFWRSLW